MRRTMLFMVSLVVTIVGCGDARSAPTVPEAGVLHFDAAMIGGGDAGQRSPAEDAGTPTELPPAVISPDGVLTPFPHIRVSVTPIELEAVSLNFVVTHDGDSRGPLLTMYLELRNVGSAVECGFVPENYLDAREIVASVEAEPYYERYSTGTLGTVTNDCIPPGGVGVMRGVQRGLDEGFLATASTLAIDASPFRSSFVERVRALDGPSTAVSITTSAEGWTLSGTITPQRSIRNYSLSAYPRDARGVLYDQLLAFPGELGTLPALVPQAVQTGATPRAFDTYLAFQSWIVE